MWLPNTIKLFLVLATCLGHVISSPVSLGRIINGENAEAGEIPYQVSLQRAADGFHFCGGSILTARFVITAAHCVLGRSPESVVVIAGTLDNTQGNGIMRQVERINVHEGYDPNDAYRNDIAILRLSKQILMIPRVVESVQLPAANQSIEAGEDAVVSGWGRIVEGGQSPSLLQRVTLQISDQAFCKQVYLETFAMEVDDTQVCADVPGGGKGSCHGDSGGPLMVKNELTGLVSWANGCARNGYPTVYTRVAQFLNWIEKNCN